MAVHRVLFLCSQNVCRSPYLATTFAFRAAAEHRVAISSSSRGTQVDHSRPMCSVAVDRLMSLDDSVRKPAAHLSRQLTTRDIDRAGLILTAGLAERSAVAILSPTARSRTFTVREAVWLSEQQLSDIELARLGDADGLRGYAEVLNGRRGTLELAEPAPVRRFRRASRKASDSVMDIPDRHTLSSASHLRLFGELDRHVDTLAERVSEGLRAGRVQ